MTYTRATLCGAGLLVSIAALFWGAISAGMIASQEVVQRLPLAQVPGNNALVPTALVTTDTASYKIERKVSTNPELMSDRHSAHLTFITFEPNVLGSTAQDNSVGAKLMERIIEELPLFHNQTVIIRKNVLVINEDDDVDGTLQQKIDWIIEQIQILARTKLVNKTKTTARLEPIREFRSVFFTKAST